MILIGVASGLVLAFVFTRDGQFAVRRASDGSSDVCERHSNPVRCGSGGLLHSCETRDPRDPIQTLRYELARCCSRK